MTSSGHAGSENSPTTDDAAARRRELLGLCAAKTAGLDGAKAQRYSRYVSDALNISPRPQASGTARSVEKGIHLEYLRQLGPWLLVPVLCVVVALSTPNFWIQSLLIAVLLLTFAVPIRLVQVWSWRDKLNAVGAAMLPEAGVSIRVDAKSLTVGAMSAPWGDVRLEALEGQWLWRPRIFPKFRIDQLRLATGKESLVLDARLIENGQEVVDTICDKLV